VKIAISGASGLIGRRLLKTLTADGHTLHVLSRHAGTNLPGNVKLLVWDPMKGEPPADALRDCDAVIHLAGEPIAQRWNDDVKRRIRDSRVIGTTNLVEALSKLPQRPKTLISSSAIGYYGDRGDEVLTESSPPGKGYLPEVCIEWEKAAQTAEAFGMRVVRLRTGVVLDPKGGALAKMLPPFKLGVGGRVGDGRQWMSWIHAEDLVGMIRWALATSIAGPVNGVAPNPVTNAEFTRVLAGTIHRPAIFPVPTLGLKVLFGEMSEILLGSQRVVPNAAKAGGFHFRFADLDRALAGVLAR
jgi:uncharacterized protein (TIGR01777 family)